MCLLLNLYYLARAERDRDNYPGANYQLDLADNCLKAGYNTSSEILNGLKMERCVSAYYQNRFKEGKSACLQLLDHHHHSELAFKNLAWYRGKPEL